MWRQMLIVCLRLTFDPVGEDQQIIPTSILVGEEQGRKLLVGGLKPATDNPKPVPPSVL